MTNRLEVIEKMKNRFDPDAASGMDEVFQFEIADAGDYHVIIKNGACSIHEGEHDDPSVTLTTDADTLKKVLKGEMGGTQAFLTGKVRASGDMMLATRLKDLFPSR